MEICLGSDFNPYSERCGLTAVNWSESIVMSSIFFLWWTTRRNDVECFDATTYLRRRWRCIRLTPEEAAPWDCYTNEGVLDVVEKSGSAGEEQQRRCLRRHDFGFVDRRRGDGRRWREVTTPGRGNDAGVRKEMWRIVRWQRWQLGDRLQRRERNNFRHSTAPVWKMKSKENDVAAASYLLRWRRPPGDYQAQKDIQTRQQRVIMMTKEKLAE